MLSVFSGVQASSFLGQLAQTHYWAIETWFGSTSGGSKGVATSAFSGVPLASAWFSSAAPTQLIGVHAVANDASTVTVYAYNTSGLAGVQPFRGFSIGSRVLG